MHILHIPTHMQYTSRLCIFCLLLSVFCTYVNNSQMQNYSYAYTLKSPSASFKEGENDANYALQSLI